MNQALNCPFNYPTRTSDSVKASWYFSIKNNIFDCISKIQLSDARSINLNMDLWITDPPYADAINYHELSELIAMENLSINSIFLSLQGNENSD